MKEKVCEGIDKMKDFFQLLSNNHDALEIITQLIAIIVAIVAAFAYWHQKMTEIKTAATLVISQIDETEAIIDLMQKPENLDTRVLYKTPDIMKENYWQKYKVLLLRHLKRTDLDVLDRYYENIDLIHRGKKCVEDGLKENWKWHSLEYSVLLKEYNELKVKTNEETSIEKKSELEKAFNEKEGGLREFFNEDRIFRPGVAIDMIVNVLECFQSIKGTSTYQSLRKMSYRKD